MVPSRFLPRIVWSRTRHPVLRPLPGDVESLQYPADGLVTHLPGRHAPFEAHLCEQLPRPGTPRLAKESRTPVQQFTQLVIALLLPDSLDPVRDCRLGCSAT